MVMRVNYSNFMSSRNKKIEQFGLTAMNNYRLELNEYNKSIFISIVVRLNYTKLSVHTPIGANDPILQ